MWIKYEFKWWNAHSEQFPSEISFYQIVQAAFELRFRSLNHYTKLKKVTRKLTRTVEKFACNKCMR